MNLRFISAAEVAQRLTAAQAVDALEAALMAGVDPEAEAPRRVVELGGGQLLVMPSAAAIQPVVKLLTVGGEPRIQGICVVFDRTTLAPVALVDGVALTNLRTAAVSALAVRHLAVPDARRLLVFGRGPQAQAHATTLPAVRPVEHVHMVGRDHGNVDEVLAAADIICCCTTAREPLFDGERVADHAGATTADELVTLSELVRGEEKPGTDRPRLFKSTGMSWEDAVIASALAEAT